MIDVLNSLTEAGGGDAQDPDQLVTASSVESFVADDEAVQFVLIGDDGTLVRQTDDWKTTEDAGTDEGVVVLVTDRRVTYVVGESRDPDVDGDDVRRVHLADVADVDYSNSLLSTAFSLRNADGVEFSMTPVSMDGIEEVRKFVRRASMRWTSAREFFDDLQSDLRALEDAVANGDDERATRRRNRIYETLESVDNGSSFKSVDLPALDADRKTARRRIEAAIHRGYWYRARELTETADHARDEGRPADAAEAYADACECYFELVKGGGPVDRSFEAEAREGDLDPFTFGDDLAERLASIRLALTDEDVANQLSGWQSLRSGFDDLKRALNLGANRLDVDVTSLGRDCVEARQRIADACEDLIGAAAERGDEADDTDLATERYELALEALAERERLADAYDAVPEIEDADERRAAIEEKIERSEWEWVGDG